MAKGANVINEIDAANEANVVKEANVIDEIVVASEVNLAKEANVIDEIIVANKANKASLAKANESLANGIITVIVKYLSKLLCHNTIAICINVLPQFSLTKCSAFFSKDKVYFEICVDVRNNKLLVVRSRDELDKLVEVEAKGTNNNHL